MATEDYMNEIPGMLHAPIVGETVAGEAAAALKQVKALVKGISSNTFDLAEALHKVKKNKYYAPKYNTFSEYAKSLDVTVSKVYYLVKLVEVMEAVGVPREQYEPVGIVKLRTICRLELIDGNDEPKMYDGLPATDHIKMLVGATSLTPEQVEEEVKKRLGLMGEDAMVWVNFPIKLAARNKWDEAVTLAQKNIGSTGQDAEGNYVDASTGRCAEIIAVSYVQDPNNHPEGETILSDLDGGMGTK
jgi:hypothetical protein